MHSQQRARKSAKGPCARSVRMSLQVGAPPELRSVIPRLLLTRSARHVRRAGIRSTKLQAARPAPLPAGSALLINTRTSRAWRGAHRARVMRLLSFLAKRPDGQARRRWARALAAWRASTKEARRRGEVLCVRHALSIRTKPTTLEQPDVQSVQRTAIQAGGPRARALAGACATKDTLSTPLGLASATW